MSDVMKLDLLDQINKKINSLDLYARSRIGLLGTDDSISITPMPGGEEQAFMDGSRDKDYQVQVNAKSKSNDHCFNALTTIFQTLENLDELPSENNSYLFNKIEIKSLPNLLFQDEDGFFVWVLNISCKITIYQGVELNYG